MKKSFDIAPAERIVQFIYVLRGEKVLLDSALAELYGVETRTLNRAVNRNLNRFPRDFMFQLTPQELANLKSQVGISSSSFGGRRTRPYAFTEQGVAMLSSVLNSDRAVQVNIAIMRTFIKLRRALETDRELARKFAELEARVGGHDEKIAEIIEAIRQLLTPPADGLKKEIGFHVHEKPPPYRVRKR
jgi:predicted DNA-binding transcriptional regulator YafY